MSDLPPPPEGLPPPPRRKVGKPGANLSPEEQAEIDAANAALGLEPSAAAAAAATVAPAPPVFAAEAQQPTAASQPKPEPKKEEPKKEVAPPPKKEEPKKVEEVKKPTTTTAPPKPSSTSSSSSSSSSLASKFESKPAETKPKSEPAKTSTSSSSLASKFESNTASSKPSSSSSNSLASKFESKPAPPKTEPPKTATTVKKEEPKKEEPKKEEPKKEEPKKEEPKKEEPTATQAAASASASPEGSELGSPRSLGLFGTSGELSPEILKGIADVVSKQEGGSGGANNNKEAAEASQKQHRELVDAHSKQQKQQELAHFQATEHAVRSHIQTEERDSVLWIYVALQGRQQRIAERQQIHQQRRVEFERSEADSRNSLVMQEAYASSSMFAIAVATPLIASSGNKKNKMQVPNSSAARRRALAKQSPEEKQKQQQDEQEEIEELEPLAADFLVRVGLTEFARDFALHGFTDVDSLSNITAEDLLEMDCFSVGERRKILSRVQLNGNFSSGGSPSNNNNSPPSSRDSAAGAAGAATSPNRGTMLTSKPLAWGTSSSGSSSPARNANAAAAAAAGVGGGGYGFDSSAIPFVSVEDSFNKMQGTLREDDAILQRDWTNLRCRPTTSGSTQEDAAWETKWRVATRTDLVNEGQWEREARACIVRLSAAGRMRDPSAFKELPMAPTTHRSENGGLVLLGEKSIGASAAQQQQQQQAAPSGTKTTAEMSRMGLIPARQKLIQRRFLGLPPP